MARLLGDCEHDSLSSLLHMWCTMHREVSSISTAPVTRPATNPVLLLIIRVADNRANDATGVSEQAKVTGDLLHEYSGVPSFDVEKPPRHVVLIRIGATPRMNDALDLSVRVNAQTTDMTELWRKPECVALASRHDRESLVDWRQEAVRRRWKIYFNFSHAQLISLIWMNKLPQRKWAWVRDNPRSGSWTCSCNVKTLPTGCRVSYGHSVDSAVDKLSNGLHIVGNVDGAYEDVECTLNRVCKCHRYRTGHAWDVSQLVWVLAAREAQQRHSYTKDHRTRLQHHLVKTLVTQSMSQRKTIPRQAREMINNGTPRAHFCLYTIPR